MGNAKFQAPYFLSKHPVKSTINPWGFTQSRESGPLEFTSSIVENVKTKQKPRKSEKKSGKPLENLGKILKNLEYFVLKNP